ncbi:MAG TPA: hypothetical protein VGR06_31325 [Actinophytocola sp.]|uniref:hypothetical protein n=1 Tax=Actinophytocola sp. TaxID=1872138 RepID=UPI002E07CB84|nr:hypothetical protein [Actinophytocola sp.]
MSARLGMAATVAAALLTGCGTDVPEPHPLTMAEAERLALVRYTNYETGVAFVTARIATGAGVLVLDGRVDFVRHLGHVALSTEGRSDPASAGLLQWGPTRVAFRQGLGQRAADPLPPDAWQLRPLRTGGSELDVTLLLLLNVANDRPDNAQLLHQSTARWLRSDAVGGTPVDLFEGPTQPGKAARLTYWVDRDGKLRRLDARLGDTGAEATIDFTPGAPPIPPHPAFT